ncbi:MAG: outer membrane beta-barrel protein [Gemmataceae bacterium]|nr:outer membrane beta-barrel protein [Gemmataceae bacterium]
MKSFRGFVMAGAALAATSFGASAADLYGGRGSIKDDYIPVARGCPSWYGRVDAGYVGYDSPAVTEIGVDDYLRTKIDDTWSIGGGIGHYFSCNVRGDITVDHRFKSDVHGFNGNNQSPVNGTHKFGYDTTTVMANVYYDFDMRSRFTPYIGVGLGWVQNSISAGTGRGVGDFGGNPITIAAHDNGHVAAALMTGFSLALRERLALDAGYRFVYMGSAQTGQIRNTTTGGLGGPSTIDELHAHEFRLGLRYDIR